MYTWHIDSHGDVSITVAMVTDDEIPPQARVSVVVSCHGNDVDCCSHHRKNVRVLVSYLEDQICSMCKCVMMLLS